MEPDLPMWVRCPQAKSGFFVPRGGAHWRLHSANAPAPAPIRERERSRLLLRLIALVRSTARRQTSRHRRPSMAAILDPGLDFLMRHRDATRLGPGANACDGRASLRYHFCGRLFCGPNELRHRLAVPRDRDLAAFLDLIEQAGQMGLGFKDADVFHGNKLV